MIQYGSCLIVEQQGALVLDRWMSGILLPGVMAVTGLKGRYAILLVIVRLVVMVPRL
jgi:hypothetical protein